MACFWGVVGHTLGGEHCADDGSRSDTEGFAISKVSWMTGLYEPGSMLSADLCNPWYLYTTALHWAVMTTTSIGYGDIVPMRVGEYWASMLCMLFGGIMWAAVIGGICAVIARCDPIQESYEQNVDLVSSMMSNCGMPRAAQTAFRTFLREAKRRHNAERFCLLAQRFSPTLREELLVQVCGLGHAKLPYLRRVSRRCLMHLAERMERGFFVQRDIVSVANDVLCVVDRGTVARSGQILGRGGAFHADFIVENPQLRNRDDAVAVSYSLILTLHRDQFFEAIEGQLSLLEAVKRASLRYALSRCVQLCVQEHKRSSGATPLSLIDAFDRLPVAACKYSYAKPARSSAHFAQDAMRSHGGEAMPIFALGERRALTPKGVLAALSEGGAAAGDEVRSLASLHGLGERLDALQSQIGSAVAEVRELRMALVPQVVVASPSGKVRL
eukprot:CAMPEP_0176267780 /NCGR_PEP_ID=MMETSP0121_2-20121125/43333_1 /TAXON_ID=160619 /ORGANISM="Kryptoperidinium foliaceum, Strain CCMP 1326" /LENGTH=441 /DNA_ID=CAMNT_0017607849 /DNA_START=1 /DNA_END=1326 /DNA_ORIENTATION=+